MLKNKKIYQATEEELTFILDMAKNEGWNPGIHDAAPFFAADPQGFFLAEIDGVKVGALSAIAYDDNFGFLGLYIVEKLLRNQGIGQMLWEEGIKHLGDRNIGGDAVIAQQSTYIGLGYKIFYKTIRYQMLSGPLPLCKYPHNDDIVPLGQIPFTELLEYDSRFFPAKRASFLKEWVKMPNIGAYALQKGGILCGYGIIRPCIIGYKIGPLFANTSEMAEQLFCNLITAVPQGSPVFIDIPEPNKNALRLLSLVKMQPVFETGRMYNKGLPPLPLENIYGVTTLELG